MSLRLTKRKYRNKITQAKAEIRGDASMKNKVIVLVLSAILLALCGCSGEAVSLTELPDPTVSVEEFFEYLSNEEYTAADELVYNYVTLGMTKSGNIDDALMQVFCRQLKEQRSYEVVTEPQVSGKTAIMTVKVTTLDLREVYDPLIENVKETIRTMQYNGENTDSEEIILEVASEELSSLLTSDKPLTTTGIFAIELVYSNGKWRLIISDELYSALIGYAV